MRDLKENRSQRAKDLLELLTSEVTAFIGTLYDVEVPMELVVALSKATDFLRNPH